MEVFEMAPNMQPIHKVAIIGAGNMGSGIAQKTAQEEFDVQMVDREEQWVKRKRYHFQFPARSCRKKNLLTATSIRNPRKDNWCCRY